MPLIYEIIILIVSIHPSISLNSPCCSGCIKQPGVILCTAGHLSFFCDNVEIMTIVLYKLYRHDSVSLSVIAKGRQTNNIADGINHRNLLLVVIENHNQIPRPFCVQHANTSYLIPLGVILAPLKMNPRILNGSLIRNHRILNGSNNNFFISLYLILPMFGWRRGLWAQDLPHILDCK